MEYNYIFNPEKCWFKKVCEKADTEQCTAICKRYKYFDYLINMSLLGADLQRPIKIEPNGIDDVVFDRLNTIKQNSKSFVGSGGNLFISSDYNGNGKTSWAVKILLQYLSTQGYCEGPKALFINVPEFLFMIKMNYAGYTDKNLYYILDNLKTVELVVWDDICTAEFTKSDYTALYVYINSRMDNKKANIFTSNISNKDNLINLLGNKLYSRIVVVSECLQLNCPLDFRVQHCTEDCVDKDIIKQ